MLFHRCALPRPAFVSLRARSLALRVASKRKRIRRSDPTLTATLRAKYEADMVRRFKALKRSIHETIAVNDAFGLNVNAAAAGAFAFSHTGDSVASFMGWLQEEVNNGILEVRQGTTLSTAARGSWQNIYIDSAYQRGIGRAGREIRGAGGFVSNRWIDAAFNRPIHADAVGLIYTRVYGELKGVTDAMSQGISRSLARGMAEGRGMMDLARDLEDEVDGIGILRARTIARTETIEAHAEATLNAYEEAQIEGVEVEAEFSTAGDEQVCPECQDLEGTVMSLDDARGVIPVHPNCRCAFIPVIQDASNIELQ